MSCSANGLKRHNRFMSMSQTSENMVLQSAIGYAHAAGSALLRRPTELLIDHKTSQTDVVTHMDKLAEELIVSAIHADFPDDGILGEEGADFESKSGFQWVIDPLDGTINYLYEVPAWAVSIARVQLATNQTQVGVVYAPALSRTYFASLGQGAYRTDSTAQLSVGSCSELAQALVGTGFAYDSIHRAGQARVLTTVLPVVRDIRRIGSCALDLCFVAEGLLDAFYERKVNPWDHAAGSLIAREAGATVSGLRGKSESAEMIVAANPDLHAHIAHLLESVNADSDNAN